MLSVTATNLPRVMACNGSLLMEGQAPSINEPNPVQDEGNAAHWLIEQVHKGAYQIEELIDRKASNGTYITVEMAEHVEQYLNVIGKSGSIECDTSHSGSNWHIAGRADGIEYDSTFSALVVDDFKYGWGIVEAFKNWTLISHAIGYCRTHLIIPSVIRFRIHQPRPYHPQGRMRSWDISWEELCSFYEQINATLSNPTDVLNTGPHCYKCPAIAFCPAARAAELNGIDASEKAFNEKVDNIHLSYQLDHLKRASAMLKLRIDAYEDLALDRIRKGEIVNNYTLEKEMTNTVWFDNVDANYLRIITGKDLTKKDLVTPNQAKKQGVPEEVIKALTTRHQKGTKLVRMDANKKAEKLFKKG